MENHNIYTGTFRQGQPYMKGSRPSIYEQTFQLGKEKDEDLYFSNIKIRIKPASVDFPNPMLQLQMANGRASVFQRCTPEQLINLADWIYERVDEIADLWAAQEQNALQFQAMRSASDQLAASMSEEGPNNEFLQQLQLMQQMGNLPEMSKFMENLQSMFAQQTNANLSKDNTSMEENPSHEPTDEPHQNSSTSKGKKNQAKK